MSGTRNPRSLRNLEGSGAVTIDKADLQRDGLLTEDRAIPGDQQLFYERLGEGVYLFRAIDDGGEISELGECEAVRQLVAEQVLERLEQTTASLAD